MLVTSRELSRIHMAFAYHFLLFAFYFLLGKQDSIILPDVRLTARLSR